MAEIVKSWQKQEGGSIHLNRIIKTQSARAQLTLCWIFVLDWGVLFVIVGLNCLHFVIVMLINSLD